jgi:hypothetical protein
MTNLKEVKTKLIENVIATVVSVISEKCRVPVQEIEFEGSPISYTGDVGIFISVLLELHDIFEMEMSQDLNKIEERFPTIGSIIEYFMTRLIDEKI